VDHVVRQHVHTGEESGGRRARLLHAGAGADLGDLVAAATEGDLDVAHLVGRCYHGFLAWSSGLESAGQCVLL
jgi:hypothetical protein